MYFLYDLLVRIAGLLLPVLALFKPKIRSFLNGRKQVWHYLETSLEPGKPRIWMHTASLGEFEQGLPVLEHLREAYPGHQFLVTFFSPSGYEIKKDKLPGVAVCYLPLDTAQNARRFLEKVRPEIALFVKYEVWPNLFRELGRNQIPIVMFSALFRPDQAYFRWYGGLLRKSLKKVSLVYVQDQTSVDLLQGIGLPDARIAGDTRLDRVSEIAGQDNRLDFMDCFAGNRICLVAGSTWAEDEEVIVPFLNNHLPKGVCVVVAPHQVGASHIERLETSLLVKTVRYSKATPEALELADVLILDTIGLLTKVYHYASVAYVGGGFRTGLHNTLEPAVFGIPILIGPRFEKFREACDLVRTGGIRSVSDAQTFREAILPLLEDREDRHRIGAINRRYVEENRGASIQITQGVRTLL